ncbi:hypothetical protein CPT_MG40_044 [Salmonella phage MG40]|nr:hypothetical protein CPT_MG40_044 [Salmonella phage MG40]
MFRTVWHRGFIKINSFIFQKRTKRTEHLR